MSLSRADQIKQLLEDKEDILITFRKDVTGDAIGSAIALLLFFEKIGKNAEIVVDDFKLPKKFKFLDSVEKIQPQPNDLQNFIISLDIEGKGLKNISYDIQGNDLKIYVSPQKGMVEPEDINATNSKFKYDTVVTVDTQSLKSLGEFYEKNTSLFFDTPIINIDHSNNNEYYGHINFVDITSTSTVELVFNLLKELGEEYVEEDIATSLLTGLIDKTQSFKTENVSPQTLGVASELINLGADRDNIVKNLFRTRSIKELKLWGQALAHLNINKDTGLAWTTLTREDFVRCGADESDIEEIIDELIKNAPEAKLILILHEHPRTEETNMVHGILSGDRIYNTKNILKPFSPTGNKSQASFKITGKSLKEVEEEVTSHIDKIIKEKYQQ